MVVAKKTVEIEMANRKLGTFIFSAIYGVIVSNMCRHMIYVTQHFIFDPMLSRLIAHKVI